MNKIIIAAVLSLFLLVPAAALTPAAGHGISDKNWKKSFKITSYGTDKNGNPYMTVEGMAGEFEPEDESSIYAYVFVTKQGTYAVTSHMGNDTPDEEHDELDWHAHKITLDRKNCITSLNSEGEFEMMTNRVTLLDTGTSSVSEAMAFEFEESGDKTCATEKFSHLKKQNGLSKSEIGVMIYTHGDGSAVDHEHSSAAYDNVMQMEKVAEERLEMPAEVVTHMPYNWDDGLTSLSGKTKYAIFMYTDMFGPDSTVIHNVTRGVFGGIEAYDYCPGVPMGDACMYMGQVTEEEPTGGKTVLVFAEPARPDHPVLRDIFVKQAKEASIKAKNEIVVLVGHGAKSNANDAAQEAELSRAAAYVEKKLKFLDSVGVTAREDWPTLKPAAVAEAVAQIQAMLDATGAQRVVLVPATGSGSGFEAVKDALTDAGITFVEAPEPLPLGDNEFKKWSEQVLKETKDFIKKNKPREATIAPYWSRTY